MSESAEHGHSPLAQFEVHPIVPFEVGGYNLAFTNSSAWMLAGVFVLLLILGMGARKKALVPGRMQGFSESLVQFVSDTVSDTTGKEALKYLPMIFTLFVFILFANLMGMLPYSFTTTSHIIVTFALALITFALITLLAIVKHGPVAFFGFFAPKGVPLLLMPLMIPIEVISYFARPFSLALRLAINMIAGHTLLKVIAGFVAMMGIFGIFPLAFLVVLIGFEFGIALLQAYVFTILTCVYLNDAIHLH